MQKKCKEKLFCHENGAALDRALRRGGISTLKISKTWLDKALGKVLEGGRGPRYEQGSGLEGFLHLNCSKLL